MYIFICVCWRWTGHSVWSDKWSFFREIRKNREHCAYTLDIMDELGRKCFPKYSLFCLGGFKSRGIAQRECWMENRSWGWCWLHFSIRVNEFLWLRQRSSAPAQARPSSPVLLLRSGAFGKGGRAWGSSELLGCLVAHSSVGVCESTTVMF